MSWEDARETLLRDIVPLMEDRAKGERWVDLLGRSEDGMRLGACVVIDFRYGAIRPEVFADILDQLDFSKEDAQKSACWAFHDAMMNHPDNRESDDRSCFSCSSGFAAGDDAADEAYGRVLNLSDFIGRVISTKEKPLSALHRDDRERVKRRYFGGEENPWEALERKWTGKLGRVFVTSWDELTALLDGEEDPGQVVNDALGLGLPRSVEFVAVKYPGMPDTEFHQPSVLDVDWANVNWYVSQRNVNAWGRTHRCSGSGPTASERVHPKLESLGDGFAGRHIGKPRNALKKNRDKLLQEAFDRM